MITKALAYIAGVLGVVAAVFVRRSNKLAKEVASKDRSINALVETKKHSDEIREAIATAEQEAKANANKQASRRRRGDRPDTFGDDRLRDN